MSDQAKEKIMIDKFGNKNKDKKDSFENINNDKKNEVNEDEYKHKFSVINFDNFENAEFMTNANYNEDKSFDKCHNKEYIKNNNKEYTQNNDTNYSTEYTQNNVTNYNKEYSNNNVTTYNKEYSNNNVTNYNKEYTKNNDTNYNKEYSNINDTNYNKEYAKNDHFNYQGDIVPMGNEEFNFNNNFNGMVHPAFYGYNHDQKYVDPKFYEQYGLPFCIDPATEQPLYVNVKQYNCIRKRKLRRDFLDTLMKQANQAGYLHESRHKHAMNRLRAPSGRFLTKEETRELLNKQNLEKNNK